MRIAIVLVLCGVQAALANSAYQSDWTGGPGLLGPGASWGDRFLADTNANWSLVPGQVILSSGLGLDIGSLSNATSISCADLDSDGDMDIAAAASGATGWFENLYGTGQRYLWHSISTTSGGIRSFHCIDVDGDGDADILEAAKTLNDIGWWENSTGQGTAWIPHGIDTDFGGASSIRGADMDGDGDVDVTSSGNSVSDIAWWENVGGGGTAWIKHTVDVNFEGALCATCFDIDGDGSMDILAAGNGTWAKQVAWWDNLNGTGTAWTEHTIDSRFNGACSVTAADLDGDGDLDAVGAAQIDDDIAWWQNGGGGLTWVENTIDGSFDGAQSVAVGDLDGDGDIDVLGAATTAGDVAWWENASSGSGSLWADHPLDTGFASAYAVAVAQLNGTGDLDAVSGSYTGSGYLKWWNLDNFYSAGYLESSILDTQCDPDWGVILWASYLPSGTVIGMRMRSSDNYAAMGDWSDTILAPSSLQGILDDGDRFFQYKVTLMTTNPLSTPSLLDLTVTWDPLGVEGGATAPETPELAAVFPNPSRGSTTITFGLPSPMEVTVSVFDCAGRMLAVPGSTGMFGEGLHELKIDGLAPGIYFCRMSAGGLQLERTFAVIE